MTATGYDVFLQYTSVAKDTHAHGIDRKWINSTHLPLVSLATSQVDTADISSLREYGSHVTL